MSSVLWFDWRYICPAWLGFGGPGAPRRGVCLCTALSCPFRAPEPDPGLEGLNSGRTLGLTPSACNCCMGEPTPMIHVFFERPNNLCLLSARFLQLGSSGGCPNLSNKFRGISGLRRPIYHVGALAIMIGYGNHPKPCQPPPASGKRSSRRRPTL